MAIEIVGIILKGIFVEINFIEIFGGTSECFYFERNPTDFPRGIY